LKDLCILLAGPTALNSTVGGDQKRLTLSKPVANMADKIDRQMPEVVKRIYWGSNG
ncbi:hypothetical protein HDU93_003473, partial [Gonapodya sp. JEL0774]